MSAQRRSQRSEATSIVTVGEYLRATRIKRFTAFIIDVIRDDLPAMNESELACAGKVPH